MMKRRRTRRDWLERGVRWGLTVLFVALVGVMVASGWCRLAVRVWSRPLLQVGIGKQWQMLEIRRGRLTLGPDLLQPSLQPEEPFDLQGRFFLERDPAWAEDDRRLFLALYIGPSAPPPFDFWRIAAGRDRFSIALTYPVAAVALPAGLLWVRHVRRQRRHGVCSGCGYDLTGLTAGEKGIVCPECGEVAPATQPGAKSP